MLAMNGLCLIEQREHTINQFKHFNLTLVFVDCVGWQFNLHLLKTIQTNEKDLPGCSLTGLTLVGVIPWDPALNRPLALATVHRDVPLPMPASGSRSRCCKTKHWLMGIHWDIHSLHNTSSFHRLTELFPFHTFLTQALWLLTATGSKPVSTGRDKPSLVWCL